MKMKSVIAGEYTAPPRAGTHDQRQLRNDPGGHDIALEHLCVSTKGGNALLYPGSAGVADPDHRRTHLHCLVHDLADLFGMGFGKRSAEHGEILAVYEREAAIDGAVTHHHTVTGDGLLFHSEIRTPVFDEYVPLLETALVEQHLDALPGGEFALGMLGLYTFGAAAQLGPFTALLQLFNYFMHILGKTGK